jgi:hypothetical protein
MTERIAASKFVLDLDNTHTIELREEEKLSLLGYYAMSVGNFLPNSGASLLFPSSSVKD